jgi:hypothetical protein
LKIAMIVPGCVVIKDELWDESVHEMRSTICLGSSGEIDAC